MQPFFYYNFQNQNTFGKKKSNTCSKLSNTFSSLQPLLLKVTVLVGQIGTYRHTQTHRDTNTLKHIQLWNLKELHIFLKLIICTLTKKIEVFSSKNN